MSARPAEERVSPDSAGEKPVREKLQKASIDASTAKDHEEAAAVATAEVDREPVAPATADEKIPRGRPRRKRSHDEATEGQEKHSESKESKHGRKRSRDGSEDDNHSGDSSKRQSFDIARPAGTSAEKTATNGEHKSKELKRSGMSTPPLAEAAEPKTEAMASPKSKRSRVGAKSANDSGDATLESGTHKDEAPSLEEKATESKAEPNTEAVDGPKSKRSRVGSKGAPEIGDDATSGPDTQEDEASSVEGKATEGKAEPDTEAVAGPQSKRSRVGTKSADETGDATSASGTHKDEAPSLEGKEATGGKAEPSTGKKDITTEVATESTTTSKDEASAVKSVEKAPAVHQTSPTAFASSGFGAFANSTTSGFGAIGAGSKLSTFASPEPESERKENTKPSTSTFGGALGATPAFGGSSSKSVFGSGSGFGSGFGGGGGFSGGFGAAGAGKLSTFASSTLPPLGGKSKPARPFGAPANDDDDDDDEDDSGGEKGEDEAKVKSPREDTQDRKDERFFVRQTETGEENERTEFTCRAKLYNFVSSDPNDPKAKKEWKERGVGTLRLNVSTETGGGGASSSSALEASGTAAAESGGDKPSDLGAAEGRPQARLVMRADGSHRVILNTPIKKELKFGSVTGDVPQGQVVHFMGSIDSKPKLELLQLKMRQQIARELYDHIVALQRAM